MSSLAGLTLPGLLEMRRTPLVQRDKVVQSLVKSFPGRSAAIERAYEDSGYFRSICTDFHECTQALIYWNTIESDEASANVEEYRELLGEIEREILDWLDVWEDLLEP